MSFPTQYPPDDPRHKEARKAAEAIRDGLIAERRSALNNMTDQLGLPNWGTRGFDAAAEKLYAATRDFEAEEVKAKNKKAKK